jgi:hypothetical protein
MIRLNFHRGTYFFLIRRRKTMTHRANWNNVCANCVRSIQTTMKKWYWLATAIVILAFLAARFVYHHVEGVDEERLWYITQLHYDFSARIDSVTVTKGGSGLLYFHPYRGVLNDSQEQNVKTKLKYNGQLDFILFSPKGRTALFVRYGAGIFLAGDSLVINTDAESGVEVFRNQKMIATEKTIDSINGRPF